MITWKQPFTQVLDESNAPFFKWFADGKLISPVALEQGSKFAIREGGLTVGAGTIVKVKE